jgi:hypothetical protein
MNRSRNRNRNRDFNCDLSYCCSSGDEVIPNLLIVFLLVVPIIEFVISEINREYLLCGDDWPKNEHNSEINLYEWSVVKNIFSIVLSLLVFFYFMLNKLNLYRFLLRIIIYAINLMNLIWLIVGISLFFDTKCEDHSTSYVLVYIFFNVLFGTFGIYIVNFSMNESFKKNSSPLLDEREPYTI